MATVKALEGPLLDPAAASEAPADEAEQLIGRAPEKPGAPLRSGVFVLANTLLGAGMLGLPGAFADCGYAVGAAFLVFFAACGALGLHLLAEAAHRVPRPASLYSVAEAAAPRLGILIDAAIAIKCFGVATSYLIVIGDTVPLAASAFGGGGLPSGSPLSDRHFWILCAVAVAGPLSVLRKITALRHSASFALSCVLLITLVVR